MKFPHKILREIPRDIIALGSLPFFILVLVRVSILSKQEYLMQFVLAGVLFFILMFLFKSNMHSGLGFVMLFFTIIYYNDLKFSILAILIYLGLLASLIYFKIEKIKIFSGILFGVISSAISYYAGGLIF
ncbi:MAG: hypothetical protein AABX28_01570 [Nanoarchaeota archaeon]